MTGTNVGIEASTVSADGTLDVMAYNDLSITAGMENSSYSYKSSSGGGGFFGKKKTGEKGDTEKKGTRRKRGRRKRGQTEKSGEKGTDLF